MLLNFICQFLILAIICSEMAFRSWIRSRIPIDKVNSWKTLQGRWGNVKGKCVLFLMIDTFGMIYMFTYQLYVLVIIVQLFCSPKNGKQEPRKSRSPFSLKCSYVSFLHQHSVIDHIGPFYGKVSYFLLIAFFSQAFANFEAIC